MSTQVSNPAAVPADTLVVIKISVNDSLKKLKLPLRDLGANVLLDKLRSLLGIKPDQPVIFERFSDSAGSYVVLDPKNAQVFKTLMRAAKAKLKLRLKATVLPAPKPEDEKVATEEPNHTQSLPGGSTSTSTLAPVIVHSPSFHAVARESTALDNCSVGSGIFQFREARASKADLTDAAVSPLPQEAPVPSSEPKSATADIAIRPRTVIHDTRICAWSVHCNACDSAMAGAHYHCNICDGGDYDLCESCVAAGKVCPGEGHWLIKRFIKDGRVISSFTERLSPRPKKEVDIEDVKPVKTESSTLAEPNYLGPLRTCNSCVVIRNEQEFVTCKVCSDFDLCIPCHSGNKHGHHPAHAFKPATSKTELSTQEESLLAAGRNVRHNAICDGCDKKIFGVRHKCLNCPDWDYCQDCIVNARQTHPRHRFAPLYEQIPDGTGPSARHVGVYCDGPLCNRHNGHQAYITGVRYKCAVCNDLDFCASCEAIPSNTHNRTHPLIMFKTPVSGVSISTINETANGSVRTLGDRPAGTVKGGRPATNTNTAAQIQTIADFAPAPPVEAMARGYEEAVNVGAAGKTPRLGALLTATFIRDTITDGTNMSPGTRFTQVWTMRNTGPTAWPDGCSVHFVGGDIMLDFDQEHPVTITEITGAKESNVVGRSVRVGEDVAFKVSLRAPKREGAAISYWRLKTADGTPFGHRLWCDIVVTAALPPPRQPRPVNPMLTSTPEISQQQQQLAWSQERMAMRQRLMATHQQNHHRHAKGVAGPSQTNMCRPLRYPHHAQAPTTKFLQDMPGLQQAETKAATGVPDDMFSPPPHFLAAFNLKPETPCFFSDPPQWYSEAVRARKEAAKNRVEHIRAKVIRAREDRMEARDAARTVGNKVDNKSVHEVPSAPVKPEPVVEKAPIEVPQADDLQGSQMVFPMLEKESPASSTYQSFTTSSKGKAAYVENEKGEIEHSASPASGPAAATDLSPPSPAHELEFDDITDDLEVLSADGEVSEEDGFHTDEEYDILDASDRETVASP